MAVVSCLNDFMGVNRTGLTRVDMGKFQTVPTARPNNAMVMPHPTEDVANDTKVITTVTLLLCCRGVMSQRLHGSE